MKDPLITGADIPDFNLTGVDGAHYKLNSFDDRKGFVIIFMCNHCPYVQAYLKRIISIQKDYREKGIQVIGINPNNDKEYTEDSFENMQLSAKENDFNFPYLRDETQKVAKAFGASHTPEIFLFNAYKKLVFHGKIDDNWNDEKSVRNKYLRNAIDEMLEGKEISVPETFTIGCTIKWK